MVAAENALHAGQPSAAVAAMAAAAPYDAGCLRFLATMAHADPGLPVVTQARAEYARLH